MGATERRKYRDRAREHRESGEFHEAGEYYTLVAYDTFAEGVPESPGSGFGRGLCNLLRGAICYRLAGADERCNNRSLQGKLVAEDMRARAFETEPPDWDIDRARRGVWDEFVGDFEIVGEFGDPGEAYDRAIDVYERAGDPDTFESEQEQVCLMAVYRDVASGSEHDPGPIDDCQNDSSLSDWVRLKRDTFADRLEQLYEAGEWPLGLDA